MSHCLKKMNGNKIYFLWHQAWPHNYLLLLKTKVQLLHHTYLWPPLMWHNKAMDKGKIEAMATKFSEKFAINMLKKHRKFCRCGFTHLDATPIFQKSSRYLWDTLYILYVVISLMKSLRYFFSKVRLFLRDPFT